MFKNQFLLIPFVLLSACADEAPEPVDTIASLRDRMESTKVEKKESFWSTANTLEERQQKMEKIIEAGDPVMVIDMHDMGGWEFDELLEDPFPSYILALVGK